MRSLIALSFLTVVAACAPKTSPQSGGRIYLGSMCSPSTPSKRPVMRQATEPDSRLAARGAPALVVIVDSSSTLHRLADAAVVDPRINVGRFTDDSGRAQLDQLHDGENRLRVRRVGYISWEGVIRARAGYRDTMELGLGGGAVCITAEVGAAEASVLSGPSGELVVRVVRVQDGINDNPETGPWLRLQRGSVVAQAQAIDSGLYAFPALPVGRYRLRVLRMGFMTREESVTVRRDAVDTLERTLKRITCDLVCDGDANIFRGLRP